LKKSDHFLNVPLEGQKSNFSPSFNIGNFCPPEEQKKRPPEGHFKKWSYLENFKKIVRIFCDPDNEYKKIIFKAFHGLSLNV
jgi:hypothetical protein